MIQSVDCQKSTTAPFKVIVLLILLGDCQKSTTAPQKVVVMTMLMICVIESLSLSDESLLKTFFSCSHCDVNAGFLTTCALIRNEI